MVIYALSNNAFQFIGVTEAVRPYAEKAAAELNLIAHLSVCEGDKIILIDRVVPDANTVVYDLNSKSVRMWKPTIPAPERSLRPMLVMRPEKGLSTAAPLPGTQSGP